jgi:hypothetical protein
VTIGTCLATLTLTAGIAMADTPPSVTDLPFNCQIRIDPAAPPISIPCDFSILNPIFGGFFPAGSGS